MVFRYVVESDKEKGEVGREGWKEKREKASFERTF